MLEVFRSPSSSGKAADHQLLQLQHVDDVGFQQESSFMVGDDLLDYIDFTCCDVVPSFFDADGDILPDLEVDPTEELLAEFEDHHHLEDNHEDNKGTTSTQGDGASSSSSSQGGHREAGDKNKQQRLLQEEQQEDGQKTKKISGGGRDEAEVLSAVTAEDDSSSLVAFSAVAPSSDDTSKSSSSSAASAEDQGQKSKKKKPSKNSNGKRKVDWTPELHRRFVQAVEQLGIDKAVPSRILEIMGIECLTRHNIASHLQKYRSHRKHLMAREAEAATWAQKRQMYAAAGTPRTKDIMPPPGARPWVVPPTVGFPPPPFCRPLHVWGHPPTAAVDATAPLLPVWPRHLAPPPRPWAPVDPAAAAAYWYHQQYNGARKWAPHQAVTQGTPCVPPTMPAPAAAAMLPRFPAPPVPGMMMFRPPMPPPPPLHTGSKLATLQLQLDAHPSKESIDAAIGDVLVKPWLPLPLGLKPPSLDSVMSELHKQGIPKIPPAATTNTTGS